MKFKFSFLVGLAAALIAGCAAYYSVFGLSQLFAGASMAVIIMASSLEFGKVVVVSLLQRNWSKISRGLKIYLSICVLILVSITSAGIYGFLSNAYQKTASKYEISEGQLSVLTNKKGIFEKSISDNQAIIKTKTSRLEQLSNLRTTQETRLDNATSNSNRSRARTDIDAASKEIQKLNVDIDATNAKNAILSDSVNFYSNKMIESKGSGNATSELGPLKYLAQLTGQPMDKVVNYFILLLIFVFDPLAVALVISTNKMIELEQKKKEDEKSGEFDEGKKNDEIPEEVIPEVIPELAAESEIEEIKSEVIPEVKEPIEVVPDEVKEPEEIIEEVTPIETIIETHEEESQVEEIPSIEEVSPDIEIPVFPVMPQTGTTRIQLTDIREVKERTNRGFSKDIPLPNNGIQRIDSSKPDSGSSFFKRRK